ncbi:hypothetical protein [Nostoc sp.]|uniref:hypothetical protein n=1 Tax=Nostoc sp. TaxID=1180 RepID=UPI002FF5EEE4
MQNPESRIQQSFSRGLEPALRQSSVTTTELLHHKTRIFGGGAKTPIIQRSTERSRRSPLFRSEFILTPEF